LHRDRGKEMRFFTADEHVDHPKVLLHQLNRALSFKSLEEMQDEFVYRHNNVVRPQDEVYHLGDVAFKWQSHSEYISRLNGNHFLIKGNHERSRDVKKLLRQGGPYAWIKDVYMIKKPQLFWLSHYPHVSWPQNHYGCIHLHGHSHGNLSLKWQLGKIFDVGVDCNHFAPVSEEELIVKAAKIVFVATDHDRSRNDE
jgi:calcineurin-like phosphoesterase family protein